MALTSDKGGDYNSPPPGCALTWKTCDDPGPAIDALSHGRISDFFELQPFMGPVTLFARAPVVAVVRSAGGGVTAQYRWGSLICLLLLAVFGVWLALLAERRGMAPWVGALIAIAAVFNPVTHATLKYGHPEEVVAAVLACAALVFGVRRRPVAAGVLLGLAIATKAWALLAVPVFVLLLPALWRRGLVAVVVTVALLAGPMAIGAPERFRQNVTEVGKLGSQLGTETPTNLLWPFATLAPVQIDGIVVGHAAKVPLGLARAARTAVFAAALLLALVWWRRGLGARPETALLLLALTLMVRGLLDPSNHSYYHAGPLLALLSYEALVRRRFPFATAAFIALFEATNRITGHNHGFDAVNRVYLMWAVPFAIYMGWELLSRRPWTLIADSSRSATSPRLGGATTPTRSTAT